MANTELSAAIMEMMDDFSAACRKAGLKLTHQRYKVYLELLKSSDHPAAEAIHKRLLVEIPSISLDTVYRTLATFEQHGLISRVQTVESHARFEAKLRHHHHLICSTCNEVEDFQWEDFDQLPLPQALHEWGTVSNKQTAVYGVCRKCLSAGKA